MRDEGMEEPVPVPFSLLFVFLFRKREFKKRDLISNQIYKRIYRKGLASQIEFEVGNPSEWRLCEEKVEVNRSLQLPWDDDAGW